MPDFSAPYEEVRKESTGESERRLASILIMALSLHVTSAEEDALAKVLGMILRNYPFWKDIVSDKTIQDVLHSVKRGP